MFGAEGREWCRVENWPEQNQLVESSRLLPIAAQKNRNQPSRKDYCNGEIRPDHFPGNREGMNPDEFTKPPLTVIPFRPSPLRRAMCKRIALLVAILCQLSTQKPCSTPPDSSELPSVVFLLLRRLLRRSA